MGRGYINPLPPGFAEADEVKSKRSRHSKHFLNPVSGATVLRAHAVSPSNPVHYQDWIGGTGLREVDSTLEPDGAGGWKMGGYWGEYYASFPATSDQFITFKALAFDRGTNPDDYDEIGIKVAKSVVVELADGEGRGVVYRNALGPIGNNNVPVNLRVSCRGALEHVAEIESRPTGIPVELPLTFELDIPAGYDVRIGTVDWDRNTDTRTTEVAFIGKRGTPRSEWIRLLRSHVWDSGKLNADGSIDVDIRQVPIEVEYTQRGGRLFMTKYIPRSFLISAANLGTYPVMTDALISPVAAATDGYVLYDSATTWDEAHDASTGTLSGGGSLSYVRAARTSSSDWSIWREYLAFDCTGIGSGQQVDDVTAYLYANSYSDAGGSVQWGPASDYGAAVTTADYANCTVDGSPVYASRTIAEWAAGGWLSFTFDSAGELYIDMTTSSTFFAVRMSRDMSDTPFTSNQNDQVRNWSSNFAGREPYLDINYSAAGAAGGISPANRQRTFMSLLHH